MSSPNLRILYVITSLRTGGAERLVTEMTKILIKEGHAVDILVFDSTGINFLKELEVAGVNIYKGGKGYFQMYNPLHILRINRLAKKNRYDIIHSHNTAAQYFLAFSGADRYSKLVTTEHNSTNRRRNLPLIRPIDKFIYKKYDAVASVSNQVKKNLLVSLGAADDDVKTTNKFPVIYNGVNLPEFLNSTDSCCNTGCGRQLQGQPDETSQNVILMIAAFRRQKDHATAIRAMRYLDDNFVLWLAGEGETKKEHERMVKNLNLSEKVRFLGDIGDIPSLISEARIVILSSNHEGMPMSAIEAMASGKPFIGSDVDGLREIAADAGILFGRGDERDLANKIRQLVGNPAECMKVSKRCRERALSFNIMTTTSQYRQLYCRLLRYDDHGVSTKETATYEKDRTNSVMK